MRGSEEGEMSTSDIQARGLDCGKPYGEFGLDMVLPDEQWEMIHPDKNGLLCAACIVKRASKLSMAIVVKAIIEGV
jgi:hypothetical protein